MKTERYIIILSSLEDNDKIAKGTRETSSGLGGDNEGLAIKKTRTLVRCSTETRGSSSLNFKVTFYFELEKYQESVC